MPTYEQELDDAVSALIGATDALYLLAVAVCKGGDPEAVFKVTSDYKYLELLCDHYERKTV